MDVADLQTGNADAGRSYFNGACASCHSPSGDLAGIANRLQGLALLQRMLYPAPAGGGAVAGEGHGDDRRPATPSPERLPTATSSRSRSPMQPGSYRAFPAQQVKFTVDDPLQAHIEQLGRYTDDDMHNVFAYLQTLR